MAKILSVIRGLVSGSKVRYKEDGFDLDLTYITPRLIAMGFPASKLEGTYRNKLSDVSKFLHLKHNGCFMIYNLSERPYNYAKFDNQVLEFGFPDHTGPPLELLFRICASMDSWLNADPRNVCVVHCMAGLGRTGTVICAYMLYCGLYGSADAALRHFGKQRCKDGRGVRIPSQIRYVHYYDMVIKGRSPDPVAVLIKKLVVQPVPAYDRSGFSPILQLWDTAKEELLFSSVDTQDIITYTQQDDVIVFDINIVIQGDVSIRCYNLTQGVINIVQEQAFRIMFHTAFVGSLMRCTKAELDWAFVDKRMPENATVDIIFSRDVENIAVARKTEHLWSTLTRKLVEAAPADAESFDDEYDDGDGPTPLSGSPDPLHATTADIEHGIARTSLDQQRIPRTSLDQQPEPSNPAPSQDPVRSLQCIVINTIPRFNSKRGCQPCVQVWVGADMVTSFKSEQIYDPDDSAIRIPLEHRLQGLVIFKFFDVSSTRRGSPAGSWNLMFTITLDSSDMKQNLVRLTRSHIQCAASDRDKFDDDFHVDLIFADDDSV